MWFCCTYFLRSNSIATFCLYCCHKGLNHHPYHFNSNNNHEHAFLVRPFCQLIWNALRSHMTAAVFCKQSTWKKVAKNVRPIINAFVTVRHQKKCNAVGLAAPNMVRSFVKFDHSQQRIFRSHFSKNLMDCVHSIALWGCNRCKMFIQIFEGYKVNDQTIISIWSDYVTVNLFLFWQIRLAILRLFGKTATVQWTSMSFGQLSAAKSSMQWPVRLPWWQRWRFTILPATTSLCNRRNEMWERTMRIEDEILRRCWWLCRLNRWTSKLFLFRVFEVIIIGPSLYNVISSWTDWWFHFFS